MVPPCGSPVSRQRIVADLRALGLSPGDRVLLHSSLSSLGFVEGGPEAVIGALLDLLGPEGTLVMPSFQMGSEHVLLRQGVRFDVRTSRSEMGAITEAFRRRPDALRSLSPTHCLAGVGREAAALLAGHERCSVSAGRVLWGSDGPHVVPDLLTFAREPMTQIRSLGLGPADEALVLGGTAARLLGLALKE